MGVCGSFTDSQRSLIAIKYTVCRGNLIGATLPRACGKWSPSSWDVCVKAILDEKHSLWTTYDNFFQNIDTVCFAHSFDSQLNLIRSETAKMIDTGRNVYRVLAIIQKESENGFKNIGSSILNTTTAIDLASAKISGLQNTSDHLIELILLLSQNMVKVLNDTSVLKSSLGDIHADVRKILPDVVELRKSYEKIAPLLKSVHGVLVIWNSFFKAINSMPYFVLSMTLFFLFSWWFSLRRFMRISLSILMSAILIKALLNEFGDIELYIIVLCIAVFFSVTFIFYRCFSQKAHRQRRRKVQAEAEQDYHDLIRKGLF